jgi:curved DNA-binding protein CbpA
MNPTAQSRNASGPPHRALFPEVAAIVRDNPDPYVVLGVAPTATPAEITHAYRARLRAHHPDTRHTPAPQKADENLRQVLAAYALLRNPARRAGYNRAAVLPATPPPTFSQGLRPAGPPPAGRVRIPITYRSTNDTAADRPAPPLRAGPVRRHR